MYKYERDGMDNFLARYENATVKPFTITRGETTLITSQRVFKKLDENADGVITFAISTEDIDRSNERMKVRGIKLDNYKKNPVILWNHNSSEYPAIGTSESIKVEGSNLVSRAKFHGLTPLSQEIGALVKANVLKMTSIGFIPMVWTDEKIDPENPDHANAYPDMWRMGIRTYTKSELLEYSVVNIPMNPNAAIQNSFDYNLDSVIREGVEKGLIAADAELIKRIDSTKINVIDEPEPEAETMNYKDWEKVADEVSDKITGIIKSELEGKVSDDTINDIADDIIQFSHETLAVSLMQDETAIKSYKTKKGAKISGKRLEKIIASRDHLNDVIDEVQAETDSLAEVEPEKNITLLTDKITELTKTITEQRNKQEQLEKEIRELRMSIAPKPDEQKRKLKLDDYIKSTK